MKSIKITSLKQFIIIALILLGLSIPMDYYLLGSQDLIGYTLQNVWEFNLVIFGVIIGYRLNKRQQKRTIA